MPINRNTLIPLTKMEIETEVRAGAETKMERKQKKQLTYMSDILVVNNLWTS